MLRPCLMAGKRIFLCEIDITQDMIKKQLNRLRDDKHLAQMSWYRGS